MRLQALRAHYLDGHVQAAGAIYECPDALARQMVASGKAVALPESQAAPSAKKLPRSKPLAVKTAPALVPGSREKD